MRCRLTWPQWRLVNCPRCGRLVVVNLELSQAGLLTMKPLTQLGHSKCPYWCLTAPVAKHPQPLPGAEGGFGPWGYVTHVLAPTAPVPRRRSLQERARDLLG